MLSLDGKWRNNASCKKCRYRHPPDWTCEYSAEIATYWRRTTTSAFCYLAHSAAIEQEPEPEQEDAWEFFIKENYGETL